MTANCPGIQRLARVLFAMAAACVVSGGWAQPGQAGCSSGQSAGPVGEIAPTDFVELRSTGSCMDACPIYSVRVQGDGSVLWNGQSGVQVKGAATREVLAQAARALIESYRAAGFWCLGDRGYGDDGPEVTTTVHIGDREKTIKGTPDWKTYRSVGELAGTYYWVRGDPTQESVIDLRMSGDHFAPKPGVTI